MTRSKCSVEGCEEFCVGRGLCRLHYSRMRNKGSTDDVRKNTRRKCSVEGCERWRVGSGLCDLHYRRARRPPLEVRVETLKASREGRICKHCNGPIPVTRNARAQFCSVQCKYAERLASGRTYAAARKNFFRNRYGLTVEEVDELAKDGCQICGTHEWAGRHNRPAVDHDHSTKGTYRGILCDACNQALGKFKDDPRILIGALVYIETAGKMRKVPGSPLVDELLAEARKIIDRFAYLTT